GSMSLAGKQSATAGYKGVFKGLFDVIRHWTLTIRTSIMGAFIGMIPGLGGDAASWICYGHAIQSSKHPEKFGKGTIEGVIAPETANNSKEGGSLLPTLFFAVPGSSGMAILLGAFVMLGIQPGPAMALTGMDIVWTLIWALMIANVFAVFFFIAFVPMFGYLSYVRGSLLIPFVLALTFLGSFLGHRSWENLIVLFILGTFGYFLKKYGWPRPPFVIGLILGPIAEDSYHKAYQLWGPQFLLRPGTLIMIVLIVASIGFYIWKSKHPSKGGVVEHAS
ncbi:MAG: tricarboxylate transporter, partial [Gammaproteobacteria bacterium]|nr:tricarboxylate transporter [Gammaproteobacteria bacterium]NIO61402.1 tricarboxylate transporter [Gammaproteobacteria bacterium]